MDWGLSRETGDLRPGVELSTTKRINFHLSYFLTFRIHFKNVLFTYNATHGLAPDYIKEILTPYSPAWRLRSADQKLNNFSCSNDQTENQGLPFDFVLWLWNSLPLGVRSADFTAAFNASLKLAFTRRSTLNKMILFHYLITIIIPLYITILVYHLNILSLQI